MKSVLKIMLGIVIGLTVFVVGCTALLGTAVEEATEETFGTDKQIQEEVKNDDVPFEYEQCVDKASSYLKNVGGFSEQGLRDQLEYEGFSNEAINYAIKKVYK